MTWIDALILGLIQGLTEYLPISSSGHLEIGHALLGISGEENLTFSIVVHAATVCSTLVVLWPEIWGLIRGVFRGGWNDSTQYVAKLALSMIPIGIVGLCFKSQIESLFGGSLLVVGIMLWVTALLLTFSYYAKPRLKAQIGYLDALVVGLSQACAVLPGLSRSGTTIATGLLLGVRKDQIAQFSFLMVIPPILGETLLELLQGEFSSVSSGIPTFSLVVGFVAAFVSGCIACRWMLSLVKRGKLIYFAFYCLVAGAITIVSAIC